MATSLLPNQNHFISLAQAKEMTALFRAEKENILAPEYRGQNILSLCETFDREAFDSLLDQEDCVGIRIYWGMDPNLKIRVIAVGVNEDNSDILPTDGNSLVAESNGGKIVDVGRPCPDFCPEKPSLNDD